MAFVTASLFEVPELMEHILRFMNIEQMVNFSHANTATRYMVRQHFIFII